MEFITGTGLHVFNIFNLNQSLSYVDKCVRMHKMSEYTSF